MSDSPLVMELPSGITRGASAQKPWARSTVLARPVWPAKLSLPVAAAAAAAMVSVKSSCAVAWPSEAVTRSASVPTAPAGGVPLKRRPSKPSQAGSAPPSAAAAVRVSASPSGSAKAPDGGVKTKASPAVAAWSGTPAATIGAALPPAPPPSISAAMSCAPSWRSNSATSSMTPRKWSRRPALLSSAEALALAPITQGWALPAIPPAWAAVPSSTPSRWTCMPPGPQLTATCAQSPATSARCDCA